MSGQSFVVCLIAGSSALVIAAAYEVTPDKFFLIERFHFYVRAMPRSVVRQMFPQDPGPFTPWHPSK